MTTDSTSRKGQRSSSFGSNPRSHTARPGQLFFQGCRIGRALSQQSVIPQEKQQAESRMLTQPRFLLTSSKCQWNTDAPPPLRCQRWHERLGSPHPAKRPFWAIEPCVPRAAYYQVPRRPRPTRAGHALAPRAIPAVLTKEPEKDLEPDAQPALAGIVVGVEDGVDDVKAGHPERHFERRPDLLLGHPHLLLRGPHRRHEPLPHRGWAGRAGRRGGGPGPRPGRAQRRVAPPPPASCPGSRPAPPPARPLARVPRWSRGRRGAAAAAAPGRPRGVGVSGRLGSGSSSLQRLPRQRSHHLDPACLGRCCRCEAPEAAPAVTRERGTRPASQSGAPRSVSTRGTARRGAASLVRCHGARRLRRTAPPGGARVAGAVARRGRAPSEGSCAYR